MRILRHRPSPALVISLMALIVASAGTSYAAIKLPKNSVGTRQLKNNAVTSAKVKNGSLRKRDFKAGQLPSGPQGPQGPRGLQGPAGAQGPPGAAGKNGATSVVFRDSDGTTVAAGADGSDAVACAPGERATGGGVYVTDANGDIVNVNAPVNESDATVDASNRPNGWEGGIHNATLDPVTLVVEAICASP